MLKKAHVIDDVPNSFTPNPLMEDELDSFHIQTEQVRDKYVSFFDEIQRKLEISNIKILFAGHRGSGKSTELNRLRREIEDKYFTIHFSMRDELDIYNIDYVDLIFVLMEKVFTEGKNAGHLKNEELINNIHNWLTKTTEIKEEQTSYAMEAAAGIKPGGVFLDKIIGLFAEVKARFKLSGKTQKEMRKKVEPRISDLKNYCNLLINEIELSLSKEGKNLLIIVEDADKLELVKAKDIFYNHSGILSEINSRMVFSTHLFLLNSPDFKNLESKYERVTFPMVKVENRDGTPCEEGREILKDIIKMRMDISLIEEDALNLVIEKSGGNIRDLFEIIENGAMAGKNLKESTIRTDKIQYGINKVKADYNRALVDVKEFDVKSQDLYDKLVKIHTENQRYLAMDPSVLVLLNAQAILEYNGEQWFAIHPIVIDLLKDMKKI